ncbi:MAG: hypothetical protein Q9222_000461 [Ikaeria aurantiellina]
MVAINLVRKSNEELRNLPQHLSSPTAIFTGATQGIGLATLRQLASNTVQPTCYIIGRSEAKTQEIIDELKGLNETKEGIDQILSLRYYSRLRFIQNLLFSPIQPLLSSSQNPRIISVLAAGMEAKIIEDDMDLKHNYGVMKCANHGTTMTSLAFEHLAKENPTPLLSFIAVPLSGCGERQLYHATSSRYPPKAPTQAQAGVPVSSDIAIADGSDGVKGSGCYLVGEASEIAPSGTGKVMRDYRERGLPEKVWKHAVEIIERVRG